MKFIRNRDQAGQIHTSIIESVLHDFPQGQTLLDLTFMLMLIIAGEVSY